MNRYMLIGRERLLAEPFHVFINMHLVQARKVAEEQAAFQRLNYN